MTVNKQTALILLTMLGFVPLGCNKDSSSTGSSSGNGIALVDPDRVAAGMGWTAEMQKNLQAATEEYKKQADAHIAPARAVLDKKKADIFAAAKLTKEQIADASSRSMTRADFEKLGLSPSQADELFQAANAWQNDIVAARDGFQRAMTNHQAQLQNAYREVIFPAIREVARDKGRVAVFTLQQAVYLDSSTDITDAVISDLQKKPSLKINLPEIQTIRFGSATQPTTGPSTMPTTEPLGPTTLPH